MEQGFQILAETLILAVSWGFDKTIVRISGLSRIPFGMAKLPTVRINYFIFFEPARSFEEIGLFNPGKSILPPSPPRRPTPPQDEITPKASTRRYKPKGEVSRHLE